MPFAFLRPRFRPALLAGLAIALAGCGGGGGGTAAPGTGSGGSTGGATEPAAAATTARDATRLAHQASFGPSEALVAQIRASGPAAWVKAQMALPASQYSLGGGDAVHRNTSDTGFCDQPANAGETCWRDWYSSQPLVWDFYRQATTGADQLRQRVALALQQVLVVNNQEVTGTYGLRGYHNLLRQHALGNYRELLRAVALSPVMGEFLNNVNNHRNAPNENFARELLQLFSLGTCLLEPDGRLQGGRCLPTYQNDTVRAYAYALTGWTYPAGGRTAYGCWPSGANCQYLKGEMVPVADFHDTQARSLLSSISVPAGSTAPVALEAVLDSLMQHQNMAPFIGRQLIQHLVSSNPSPAYVQRVAAAFTTGQFAQGGQAFGTSRRGDLAATVAAVLLDDEARAEAPAAHTAKLREPVLLFTGVLRALNGRSDGEALGWWWGDGLQQHMFRPPSVFNFYPPDFPVPGTALQGPAFGIHTSNTALQRLNYLTYLVYWEGSAPSADVPGATGTRIDLTAFQADAADAGVLVDRLSALAVGGPLPAATRQRVVQAVAAYTAGNHSAWQAERVKQAAYLVFASPQYQVQR